MAHYPSTGGSGVVFRTISILRAHRGLLAACGLGKVRERYFGGAAGWVGLKSALDWVVIGSCAGVTEIVL